MKRGYGGICRWLFKREGARLESISQPLKWKQAEHTLAREIINLNFEDGWFFGFVVQGSFVLYRVWGWVTRCGE